MAYKSGRTCDGCEKPIPDGAKYTALEVEQEYQEDRASDFSRRRRIRRYGDEEVGDSLRGSLDLCLDCTGRILGEVIERAVAASDRARRAGGGR